MIYFNVVGSGSPVILLHGFPLHNEMWSDFAKALASKHRVFTPDLPGFGKSDPLPAGFTLQQIASTLLSWMKSQKIHDSVVIGHSLGGYVALHMAEQSPSAFKGLGLFHSTAYSDSDEKKESRTKVVEFVNKNGAPAFTTNFIEPLFADNNNASIQSVKEIAGTASAQTVIGYTLAMRDRRNMEPVLKSFRAPILFIAGEHDKGIPVETIKSQSILCQRPEVHVLTQSAHMGMYEQFNQTVDIIDRFVTRSLENDNFS